MKKSDNKEWTWSTGRLVIVCITAVLLFAILIFGSIFASLADEPLIFKFEADDNMVAISENMETVSSGVGCKNVDVRCICPIEQNTYPNYYKSNNWSTYWDSYNRNIVYVKGEI